MKAVFLAGCILLAGIIWMNQPQAIEALPLNTRGEYRDGMDDEIQFRINRQYLLDLISSLEQDLLARREHVESQKRGFDFGVARGYSGSEVAKHKLGLAAASNPWGPGRKKRSFETYRLNL